MSTRGPASAAARVRRTFELVQVLAPRELRLRYRHSALDIVWALLSPVIVLAVYGYVLTQGFDVGATCGPYLSSAWTGLVLWTFFATAVGGACTSVLTSTDLVGKVYFPREAIPLSVAAAALADLLVGAVTLVVLVVVQGVPLTTAALGAILPIAMLVVWTAALSTILGIVAVFLRDIVHAVQLLLRVGFFATPVMYESSFLPRGFAWTAEWNPVGVAITDVRTALLCGAWPPLGRSAAMLGVGLLALAASSAYTSSVESRIVDAL